MPDLIYVAGIVACFALALAFVLLCEKVG